MRFFPVMEREVRAESRNPMTYWMRVACAVVMLLALLVTLPSIGGSAGGRGAEFFGVLQPALFSLIWILGPIFTCDCISRERRDGTLGLLFLTPIRPVDVALAKAISGVVRTSTVILASLPMLAIPILMGGVTGQDVLRAAMMDTMALIGSVSAGLIASTRCREYARSVVMGLFLSALFLTILGSIPVWYFASSNWTMIRMSPDNLIPMLLFGPWVFSSSVELLWGGVTYLPSRTNLELGLWQLSAAVLIAVLTLWRLNRVLPRLSVETGLSKRQQWWWNLFFKPKVFTRVLSRGQRELLDRNPIGWLHRRTVSSRLVMWCWLGFVTFVLSVTLANGVHWRNMFSAFSLIMLGLGPAIAFSAADSFRKERETGAFELLLVTGITPEKLLWGRLFGIWGQYAMVVILISLLWFYSMDQITMGREGAGIPMATWFLFMAAFICIPIIGLDQSLHRNNFFSALGMTLLVGLLVPIGIPLFLSNLLFTSRATAMLFFRGNSIIPSAIFLLSCYLLVRLARRGWSRSFQNLTERRFLKWQDA